MRATCRIAIAVNDSESLTTLRNCLTLAGHLIVAESRTREEAIRVCRSVHPDLIIVDTELIAPDELRAATMDPEARVTPAICLAKYFDNELIERAVSSCV